MGRSGDYQQGKIYKLVSYQTDKVYIGSTTEKLLTRRLAKHKYDFNAWTKDKKAYITSFQLLEIEDCSIVLIENYPCNDKHELEARERYWIENTEKCVNKYIPTRTSKEYYDDNVDYLREQKRIYRELNLERLQAYDRERSKTEHGKESKRRQYEKYKQIILEKNNKYYHKNAEKCNERSKEYYEKHKDTIIEYSKQYYLDNKDKINERNKQWRDNNKERKIQTDRAWKEANREHSKQYFQDRYEQKKAMLLSKVLCGCGCEVCHGALSKHLKSNKHKKLLEQKAISEPDPELNYD